MELSVKSVDWNEEGVLAELGELATNPFHHPDWHRLFDGRSVPYCFFDRGGKVVGGFYLYRERFAGMSIARNPPLTPTIGPFLVSTASNSAELLSQRRDAASLMCRTVKDKHPMLVMLNLDKEWTDILPFLWSGFKVSPASTFLIDLSLQEDVLWKGFSGERRKSIRKAETDGLTAQVVTHHPAVETIIRQTFTRNGLKRSLNLVPRVLAGQGNNCNNFCVVAKRQERIVAAVFCVVGWKTCVYLLGGYDENERHHGSVSLCLWAAMKEARLRDCLVFDFEGSLIGHLDRFFRGFGGVHRLPLRVVRAWYPIEILLGIRHRSLF